MVLEASNLFNYLKATAKLKKINLEKLSYEIYLTFFVSFVSL